MLSPRKTQQSPSASSTLPKGVIVRPGVGERRAALGAVANDAVAAQAHVERVRERARLAGLDLELPALDCYSTLVDAVRDGRISRGDNLLLEAFGGGFTWGSALVRY